MVLQRDGQIQKMYVDDEMSSPMIAKCLGISGQTVFNALRRSGVTLRTRSEAAKLKMKAGRGNPPPVLAGENSPRWKGGRFTNQQGYVFKKSPQHTRANYHGYVREHILVWEQSNGKSLPDDWVIHHINGKRDDNRPKNLLAMPIRNHVSQLLLKQVQKRLRETERELSSIKGQGRLTA